MNAITFEDIHGHLTEWKPIDEKTVIATIRGATVEAVEPIDYPITDGVLLWLKAKDGHAIALEIGADTFNPKEDGNPFYMRIAEGSAAIRERAEIRAALDELPDKAIPLILEHVHTLQRASGKPDRY